MTSSVRAQRAAPRLPPRSMSIARLFLSDTDACSREDAFILPSPRAARPSSFTLKQYLYSRLSSCPTLTRPPGKTSKIPSAPTRLPVPHPASPRMFPLASFPSCTNHVPVPHQLQLPPPATARSCMSSHVRLQSSCINPVAVAPPLRTALSRTTSRIVRSCPRILSLLSFTLISH
jgi:hypothetical protein